MPKGKELSSEEKRLIKELKKQGESNIFIAQALGRTKSAIGKFLKRSEERGNNENIHREGRPKCTSSHTDKKIQMFVRQNNRISLSEIKNQLKEPVSKATICRRIHSTGLKAYSPRKVPYVSKKTSRSVYDFMKNMLLKH